MKRNNRNLLHFLDVLKMGSIGACWMSEREREICEHLVVEGKVRKRTSRWFGIRYEWIKP
jgi:hypothetical protein